MNTGNAIEADALTRHYGETAALAAVDLQVPSGQICAVLGPNGAGKTTLIRCALGLERPSAGRIRVLGERPGSVVTRQATGVMLQDTDLPDAMTGREHLQLFAAYHEQPVPLAALIADTGIDDFVDVRYQRLSGGQKRRIQFALALVGHPSLLFLDEPTTGLDAPARNAVWASVRRLAEAGTTVILTTHYLEEADALADRIVLLRRGRIAADGDAAAIRARVGGALISCETHLPTDTMRGLPAVARVEARGRLAQISSTDAPATLAALLQLDPAPTDLAVRKPSLEEAFALLTADHPESRA
jgi:ABC-2 type transport system ATP-binding protein